MVRWQEANWRSSAVERQFANHHKILQLVGLKLLAGNDMPTAIVTISSCREGPSWPTIRRNVSARYCDFPLCNTQQGYSPPRWGRGRIVGNAWASPSAP